MELLNIQEQVQKNKEDIKQLRSGIKIELYCNNLADLSTVTIEENVGKYALVSILLAKRLYLITRRTNGEVVSVDLGLFPAVVQGQKGDKGDDGANGERGSNIFGVSINPPSGAKVGDFYIQKKIVDGATDYIMNKLDEGGTWRPQFSMRGPQGVPGVSEEIVVPNSEDEPTDTLLNLDVNGVVYAVPQTDNLVEKTDEQKRVYATDEDGEQVYIPYSDDQTTHAYELVQRSSYGEILVPVNPRFINSATSKDYVDGMASFANIHDSYGNKRFQTGTGTTHAITSDFEVLYNKYAVSGNHVMFVLDFKVAANANPASEVFAVEYEIPEWVWEKLVPRTGNYLDGTYVKPTKYGYDVQNQLYFGFYIWKHPTEHKIRVFNLAFTNEDFDCYGRCVFDFIIV